MKHKICKSDFIARIKKMDWKYVQIASIQLFKDGLYLCSGHPLMFVCSKDWRTFDNQQALYESWLKEAKSIRLNKVGLI